MTRAPWFSVTTLLCVGAAVMSTHAAPVIDLHGTARAAGRPAPNVAVWLDAPASVRTVQTAKIALDQRNLNFSPRVLVVRVGTTIDFPNNDRVFHNVFSFRDGKVFDLGLYPVATTRPVKFDKPGLSRIFCNIHPNMAAYVMAVDTPYFAVSAESGDFAIVSVPAGSYTYHAWRAGAPERTGTVNASGEAPWAIDWP